MKKGFRRLLRDDSGQGLPEYALLLAAVVVMVVVAASLFTDSAQALFNDVGSYIESESAIAS